MVQQYFSNPEFGDEDDAWEAFDWFMARAKDYFAVEKEVKGEYIQPRVGAEKKFPIIDRIILPRPAALKAGWPDGPFGVEGKGGGKKIGPAIAQALDYSRAVFEIGRGKQEKKNLHGWLIMLRWVFLYPFDVQPGDIASVMAQNRIGYVTLSPRRLAFSCGGIHGITIDAGGNVKAKRLPMGNKTGSRK